MMNRLAEVDVLIIGRGGGSLKSCGPLIEEAVAGALPPRRFLLFRLLDMRRILRLLICRRFKRRDPYGSGRISCYRSS